MGKKDTSTGAATIAPSPLTPADIQQKEFRVSRFGGYKMRDVDEFLDQITDSFTALTAEIDRLRVGGAGPVVGSPDLDDVARQADEIIARARAEAARITAEARAAGSAAGTVAANGPNDRAAVTAFIERERSFLQSLAGLVQEHAETMKGMAKSARQASAAPGSAPPATAPAGVRQPSDATEAPPAPSKTGAAPSAPTTGEPSADRAAPRSAAEPSGAERPAERPEPTRVPDSESTVRIEEPAPARTAPRDAEPEGDRSLRELFWGED